MKPFFRRRMGRWAIVLLPIVGALTVHASAQTSETGASRAETNQRLVEKNPANEAAWGGLVEGWIEAEDYQSAERALAQWRKRVLNPSPSLDRWEGQVAFAQNKIDAAVEAWRRYVAAVPGEAEGWDLLAKGYEKQGDLRVALEASDNACKAGPSAARLAWRTRLKTRLHDWNGAAADIAEANRLDATEDEVRALYPIFERRREWLPRMEKLSALVSAKPGESQTLLDRAELLFQQSFFEAAKDDLEAALKADPTSLRARYLRGMFAWERGETESVGRVLPRKPLWPEKGVSEILRALDAETDAERRGGYMLVLGQPLLALEEVANSEPSVVRGEALLTLNRLPEAGKEIRRAVEAFPQRGDAWQLLGRLEMTNGNMKEAIEAFDRALKLGGAPDAKSLREEAKNRLK